MTIKQSQPAPTPEEVWAILKENARQMKETDRRLDKKFAETDRRLDKKFAETDREFKEIGKLAETISQSVHHSMGQTNGKPGRR